MWSMSIFVFAFAIILSFFVYWIFRWRNPPCNGRLPPGSMGFPLIGETIQFFIPSKSLDMPHFVKSRIKKYGPIFKTSLAGRPVVVSSDDDFNHFILQQEGKSVELWYLDSLAELVGQNGSFKDGISLGYIYKTLKKVITEHFGPERLKESLLPQLEDMVNKSLEAWSKHESFELQHACTRMILDFTSKVLFSYDTEKNGDNLRKTFVSFTKGLFSFPVNIPGTNFHKCMEVINEALRLSGSIGMLRRTMVDIYINGYTIPKGWTIMIVPASHLNPDTYKDPTAFNPWRWKDLGSDVLAKKFIPFGRGKRPCGGAEYSKVLLAVFIHVFVTKYRCSDVKTGEIVRTPILKFGNGHYIHVSKKQDVSVNQES